MHLSQALNKLKCYCVTSFSDYYCENRKVNFLMAVCLMGIIYMYKLKLLKTKSKHALSILDKN